MTGSLSNARTPMNVPNVTRPTARRPYKAVRPGIVSKEDVVQNGARYQDDYDDRHHCKSHSVPRGPVARSWVGGPNGGGRAHDLSTMTSLRASTSTGRPLAQRSTTNMYWPGRLYLRFLGSAMGTIG